MIKFRRNRYKVKKRAAKLLRAIRGEASNATPKGLLCSAQALAAGRDNLVAQHTQAGVRQPADGQRLSKPMTCIPYFPFFPTVFVSSLRSEEKSSDQNSQPILLHSVRPKTSTRGQHCRRNCSQQQHRKEKNTIFYSAVVYHHRPPQALARRQKRVGCWILFSRKNTKTNDLDLLSRQENSVHTHTHAHTRTIEQRNDWICLPPPAPGKTSTNTRVPPVSTRRGTTSNPAGTET